MKPSVHRAIKLAAAGAMLLGIVSTAHATSMEIIADNDFALFSGTTTSVNHLVYQNDASWPDQLSSLLTFSFTLQTGDTTFYLLGLGGGGNENISGTVNGVDLTNIAVRMSSDVGPFLTDFETRQSTVADGTFNVVLSEVQAAFPFLTFGGTTPTSEADDVAAQSPSGRGFHFDPSTAHLFEFSAAAVDATSTPEPSSYLLFLLGGSAVAFGSYRRRA